MKLLVVDDQKSVYLYLERAISFEALGFDSPPLYAEDGARAFEIIREEQPQVMLLDIQMPGMNGIQLLEKLRDEGVCQPVTLILSAYDEFQYARRCMGFGVINYLLKPIDPREVNALLSEAAQSVRARERHAFERVLPLCLNETPPPRSLLEGTFAGLGSPPFGVVCTRAGESLSDDWMDAHCAARCTPGEVSYALTPCREETQWNALRDRLDGLGMAAGLSRLYHRPAQLPDACNAAREALMQSFYRPRARYYVPGFFREPHGGFGRELSEALLSAFRAGDMQAARRVVEQLFQAFENKEISPCAAHAFCFGLLLHLNPDFMAALSRLEDGALSPDATYCDADALKNVLLRILSGMMQESRPEETSTDAEIIERVRRYIDAHYGQDLSLESMATRFYISKYQISRLFKRIYDVNYQDYVLKARMEAAARFLRSTQMKLYEVSQRVGFEEPSYFSNVFKKYYGVSPREYRCGRSEGEKS